MTEAKYKVGDRIKLLCCPKSMDGLTGQITNVDNETLHSGDWYYKIILDKVFVSLKYPDHKILECGRSEREIEFE